MSYIHYLTRPKDLTPEFIESEFAGLLSRLPAVESAPTEQDWLALIDRWNSLKAYVAGEENRLYFAFAQNMTDQTIEAKEKFLREKVQPAFEKQNALFLEAILKSKHRPALERKIPKYFFARLEKDAVSQAPINSDLRVQAGNVGTEYEKLISSAKIPFQGQMLTIEATRQHFFSDDPAARKDSYCGIQQWLIDHRPAITQTFDELVHLRDQMGKKTGYSDFVRLGYDGMTRTDFGAKEAAQFRESVLRYAVPLHKKLNERQAVDLGTSTLHPWDQSFDPKYNLDKNELPVSDQLDVAGLVFKKLSPRLAEHFEHMRREKLIDLEDRPGKGRGAFCTSIADEAKVVVSCRSVGQAEDMRTLFHEMGHAFQGWEAQKAIKLIDLHWPTLDACEITSMGMEFLSLRHSREYLSETDADRFAIRRWKQAVSLLCYVAIVDEFQHWVYTNPRATPDQRDTEWSRIWDLYKPGIDFTGIEPYKYARWYNQGHIFKSPFYYIDYAIAETGAMQLALMDAKDHDKTMSTYLKLCQIGGTKSVLEIFQAADMRSPFDPTLMRDLMAHAARELKIA